MIKERYNEIGFMEILDEPLDSAFENEESTKTHPATPLDSLLKFG